MGIAVSKRTDLTQNEYLLRFVSKEHISPNDPFWNRFLAYNITSPRSRYVYKALFRKNQHQLTNKNCSNDQLTLDSSLEPLCQKLLTNNLESGNIGSLIQKFLTRISELLAATSTDE